MILQSIATFSCLFLAASAWRIHQTQKPIPVDPCYAAKCPAKISYTECYKTYKPEGSCCSVCACSDENDNAFSIGEKYLMHKNRKCYECTCSENKGVRNALCFKAYCPKANCPPKIRVKEPNSCCEKCPSNWKPAGPPTFPPFPPFPGFPPVGDEAEVAAEDDAKANQV
ncbi:BMP-binding endothelial regulator protein-like isoform X1 [Rhopilema esculentum]|uniref:BMP-binding endothelial regulator protein-like isoform X1 n=1 Tax=Rhopilema esculentum TaxID=499914 RepID=UPI0031D827F6